MKSPLTNVLLVLNADRFPITFIVVAQSAIDADIVCFFDHYLTSRSAGFIPWAADGQLLQGLAQVFFASEHAGYTVQRLADLDLFVGSADVGVGLFFHTDASIAKQTNAQTAEKWSASFVNAGRAGV